MVLLTGLAALLDGKPLGERKDRHFYGPLAADVLPVHRPFAVRPGQQPKGDGIPAHPAVFPAPAAVHQAACRAWPRSSYSIVCFPFSIKPWAGVFGNPIYFSAWPTSPCFSFPFRCPASMKISSSSSFPRESPFRAIGRSVFLYWPQASAWQHNLPLASVWRSDAFR